MVYNLNKVSFKFISRCLVYIIIMSFCIKKLTEILSLTTMAIIPRRGQFAQIETAMTEV